MTRTRQLWLSAALFAACCAGSFLVFRWVTTGAASAQARTVLLGKPYSMMQITVARGKDGVPYITEQRTVAVNRNGAEAWVSTFPRHPESGVVRRLLRSDGRATIALEKVALRMTEYIPTRVFNARNSYASDAGRDCRFPHERDLGRSELAGIAVSVSQHEPSRTRRETVWRALEYACVPVSVRMEELVEGKWELLAESTLAWFKPGDPPEEFFNEAWFDRLQEVSPAEAVRRIAAAMGVDSVQCPACYNPAVLQELEKRYYANQSPQP